MTKTHAKSGNEMRIKKVDQGRLSTKFTERCYREFDLFANLFDNLPECNVVTEEIAGLRSAMEDVHQENPIERYSCTKTMKAFLLRDPPLDR